MIEVEILLELFTDIVESKRILSQFHNSCKKNTVIDYYYYDPLRDNLKPTHNDKLMECCRIRSKNNTCTITYKHDHYNGNIWSHSDEYEVLCSDLDIARKIFKNLGLKELVVINNTKYTYLINNYELVLECVDGLGNFLEVEYKSDISELDVHAVKNEIRIFISQLGLLVGPELNSGKPELMLLKKREAEKQ